MPRLFLAALALLLVPTTLHAQDVGASPTYGDVDLEEGFQPDPHTVALTAGGSVEVNEGACTYGFVAEAPDVDFYYTTSGGSTLYIYAEAEGDVTLLVNTPPDASWVCDDDSFGGSDPILVLPNAPDGLYNIWIGTYGDEMQSATLYISEIDPRDGASADLDLGADPTYGAITLSPGFGSNTTTLTAGGSIQANRSECTYGFVASAPDLQLNYEGPGPLYLSVESDGDTTLLVNQPDVSWICDDDSLGESNPLLVLPNAAEGVYDIWVGTYGDQMQSATLTISETDPR